MEPPSVSYCEAFQLASWLRGLEKEGLVVLDVRDDVSVQTESLSWHLDGRLMQ